jgi:PAS domain S-box-containing protein
MTQRKVNVTPRRRTEGKTSSDLGRFPEENPNPILRLAPDGRVIYANAASMPLLKEWGATVGGALPPQWKSLLAGVMESASSRSIDVSCGDRVYSFVLVPVSDRGWINLYGHDITDWKAADKALRFERDRAQTYLDVAEVMLVALDEKGIVKLINRKGSRILGYEEGELLGENWFETCLPERNREEVKRVFYSLVAGETRATEYAENPVRTKSGEERTIAWHNTILKDEAGRVIGTFSSGQDITERRKAEEALRMSEEQLRTAIDIAGLNAWMIELETRRFSLLHVTSDFRGLVPSGEIPIDDGLRFVHPDDRRGLLEALGRAVGTGEPFKAESRVVLPDGTVRWIVSQGCWISGLSLSPPRLFGVTLDLTDRKRAEELQLRAGKMQALGTLAGGIAHDFNNILLAIAGNARLAITDLPPEHPVQRSLAEIEKASARAADLVRRILAFSRPQEQARDVIQLAPVVEEALKFMRATIPAMIDIRADLAGDVPSVACDSSQIHQAVVNLVTNAAHAIGNRHGLIEVRLDAVSVGGTSESGVPGLGEGRYVRIAVIDDGCGMDENVLERIFDPFFTTKEAGLGTGLGLSVVHGIMKSHGGAVTVASEPGKGSTFHLYFPAAEAATEGLERGRPAVPRGRGERILYIDDEEAIVELASRLLERLGYEVTVCTDAASALDVFRSRPLEFDAVVTDLAMPGMSGIDLARALHAVEPDMPVLMTSGNVRPEDREAAVRIGVRELISKPGTVDELGYALDRVFREIGMRDEMPSA